MFLLQGDAYSWWKTVPFALVQAPVLRWADFLREYQEKYTPKVYKLEKRKEFINLKQNNLTVAEYGLRFTQLSVYAAALVTTEEEKCLKFEEGLNNEIRNRLTPYDLESFSRLTEAAVRAEKLVNERKAFQAARAESSKKSGKRKEFSDSSVDFKRRDNRGGFTGSRREGTGSSFQMGQSQR